MKDFAKSFYTSRAWKNCRRAYAASVGGLCEDCKAKGLITPGEIVHHKTELTPDNINDASVTLSWSNLRLVCREHHAELHGKRIKRYTVDGYGRVVGI